MSRAYSESFADVMEVDDFKTLKNLKKGPFKKILSNLTEANTLQSRGMLYSTLEKYAGTKIAKKAAACFFKNHSDVALNVPHNPNGIPVELKETVWNIAKLQDTLSSNPNYQHYRKCKITDMKAYVQQHPDQVRMALENQEVVDRMTENADPSQTNIYLKGFNKATYWLEKNTLFV